MIVLDASALVELLLNTSRGQTVAARIEDPGLSLHIPHLADVEVAQTLRRYATSGELDADDAEAALDELSALDLQRHAHEPFLRRIWELRRNFSAYDTAYVALAETLDARLLTCDSRLARAPGMSRRVEVI